MLRVLKWIGLVLGALVVVGGVGLFVAVRWLGSKDLARMAEEAVNERIDGHLTLGALRIGFSPAFPMLRVEAEGVAVVSHAFDSLTAPQRGLLPAYADSLLRLDYMSGSLNLKRLVVDRELSLHDVVLRGLGVNLVIAHNGQANYQLGRMTPDSTATARRMPGFAIDRFALEEPREIRYYNAADSTAASVVLLTEADVDGGGAPVYRLRLSGNVTSPQATLMTNLERISFGASGRVHWDPVSPALVTVEEMELRGAFLRGRVTTEVDFGDSPVVRSAAADLEPVALTDLLTLLPDSVRAAHRLCEPYLATDLAVGARLELTQPMDLTTDTLPAARIRLSVAPAMLRYGRTELDDVELDVTVTTVTNRPDSTVIDIARLAASGVSDRIEASGRISTPVSDPAFEADVNGEFDLSHLPPVVAERVPGYLSGRVGADLHVRGTLRSIREGDLLRMTADGDVTARDFYFVAPERGLMIQAGQATVGLRTGLTAADSIARLSATVTADTANVLSGGVDIALGALSLRGNADAAELTAGRLSIISITDSGGAHFRDLAGRLNLRVTDRLPVLRADLRLGDVAAGTLRDRILLHGTRVRASMRKLPVPRGAEAPHHRPASTEHAYISPDSMMRLAYARRHHPGRKHRRRVYTALTADSTEMLYWDVARGFRELLTGWRLEGSLSTADARLAVRSLPPDNRVAHIDLSFNNDTVDITGIELRAGRSDIVLTGLVTNVAGALTSQTHDTLKVSLALQSDTIDLNELSARPLGYRHRRISARSGDVPTASPLLIPVNVDANLSLEVRTMLYGDLTMRHVTGDLLVYDGGVNVHAIKADTDAGDLDLSALYAAPGPGAMHFGFGMQLDDFDVARFVRLVPVIDSIVPLVHDFSGTVGANIAATCRVDREMNLDLSTLNAAIRICGDNLAFINPERYRTLGKWLGFKDRADNTVKRMNVEMTVADGLMRVYPFAFDIDRYRLGIYGHNDMTMHFDYHISVLRSPLPFKFGITISGDPKKYKVRFGGAKFDESSAVESVSVVNDVRINLIDQIENVFRRGVRNSRFAGLQLPGGDRGSSAPLADPGLSAADSLQLIREGVLDAPPSPDVQPQPAPRKKRKRFWIF